MMTCRPLFHIGARCLLLALLSGCASGTPAAVDAEVDAEVDAAEVDAAEVDAAEVDTVEADASLDSVPDSPEVADLDAAEDDGADGPDAAPGPPVVEAVSVTTHAGAPLAIHFQLTTTTPTTAVVTLSQGSESVSFESASATAHDRTFIGVHPDGVYDVEVVVTGDDGGGAVTINSLSALETPSLPAGMPPLTTVVTTPARREPGLLVLPIARIDDQEGSFIVVLDVNAEVVWFYANAAENMYDVNVLDAHTFLVNTHSTRTHAFQLNLAGELEAEWHTLNHADPAPDSTLVETVSFHHDFQKLPSGRVLTLSTAYEQITGYPQSPLDLTPRTEPVTIAADVIVEFDPLTGTIEHQLNLWHVFDQTRVSYGSFSPYWNLPYTMAKFPSGTFDWAHANAVLLDAAGNYIVSIKHQEAVVSLTPAGEIRWILGDPAGWTGAYADKLLTPVGEDFEWTYAQHAPMVTAAGTLLVLDNGQGRAFPPAPELALDQRYSRVVEFQIDEEAMTVEQLWSYGKQRLDMYSPVVGDADELPLTGNILAVFGATLTEVEGEPEARVLELTHSDPAEVVFELEVGDNNPDGPAYFGVYRATHAPALGD